jgi:hypothetical protein
VRTGLVLVRAELAEMAHSRDVGPEMALAAAWVEARPAARPRPGTASPDADVMMTIRTPATTRLGVADEHLVADAAVADTVSLAIADVIVHRAGSGGSLPRLPYAAPSFRPAHAPHDRIAQVFARSPGCAVVAVASGDARGDLVGLRDGRSIWFAPQRGSGAAVAQPAGGAARDGRDARWADASTIAVCASLVYVWTVTGRGLAALDSVIVGPIDGRRPAYARFSCLVDRLRWAEPVRRR